jgi:osmotically-inducible protein OsmY
MADYNRNQRGSNRDTNQEWNENKNSNRNEWNEDRNYNSENRGYNSNRSSEQGIGTDSYLSRHERERDDFGRSTDFGSGDMYSDGRYGRHYESDFNSGNYGGDRNYGYASYYGAGNTYGSGNSNMGNRDRNLYDRDYQGMNRSSYANSGTRLGGSNYGSYGDRDRGYYENRDERRNEGRSYGGYSGSNYGGNFGSMNNDRDRDRNERNWWDRASDEVSSWFGDEEAERRRRRDNEMSHKGKGPKNYSRSDERIKEDINDRLSDDPFIDATEIDVTVSNGEVTLTGSVDHRSTKRRAEDLAEAVSGVKNVENRIRVSTSTLSSPVTSPVASSNSATMANRGTESSDGSSSQSTERAKNKRDYVTG